MSPAKPKQIPKATDAPQAELTDATVPNSGNDQSAPRVDDSAANPNPPDGDKFDSLGKKKDEAPVGPRGVNTPRDVKPAPSKSVKLKDVSDVTDKVDSAGSAKHPEEPHIGPRGPEAARFVRESYKVDKHR